LISIVHNIGGYNDSYLCRNFFSCQSRAQSHIWGWWWIEIGLPVPLCVVAHRRRIHFLLKVIFSRLWISVVLLA
jgi:hypothetical protein